MKIFISHSSKDEQIYTELATALCEQGHSVFNAVSINVGEIWIEEIKKALSESDVLVALVTDNFLSSSWAQAELSSAVLGTNTIRLLPIVVGEAFVPSFLTQFQYKKVSVPEEICSAVLVEIARLSHAEDTSMFMKKQISRDTETDDMNEKINSLKSALINNQLTLVCGAGVSKASYIPDWNDLLTNILNDVFFNDDTTNLSNTKIAAKDLLSSFPQSNLILGKYLRLILKENFEKVVRNKLYSVYNQDRGHKPVNYALKNDLMKAIIELARPRRNGKRLESIITFNFDDLIERSLSAHSIEYCSIWKEGQLREIDALPIFHVHGFLPDRKEIDEPNLVFSEEAYHSQFIDPYSWANLIQLNTYSANICLFVGLSLSDPNLRRLLDISWRRNQRCKHYIVMRRVPQKGKADEIATMLFDQDASSLGLNVLWCDDFSDIPNILVKIAKR